MKKWLIGIILLFCFGVGGLTLYTKFSSDRRGPVISYGEGLYYQDGITREELLRDVTAVDEAEGDVTDSLVIESITENERSGQVIVVYVARDSKNNITKVRRVLPCSGEEAQNPESEKESEPETEEKDRESEAETESETETEAESESEELAPGAPIIRLTETKLEIQKGEAFSPLEYVASVEDDYDDIYSLWRDIQISGEYDVNRVGKYELYFYVVDSAGNTSNRARFTLTVK